MLAHNSFNSRINGMNGWCLMFNKHSTEQRDRYEFARDFFSAYPEKLEMAEKYLMRCISETLMDFRDEFRDDYNEANYLFPFWGSYPPSDRGRKPVGDQVPWIEVGEHSIGHRVERLMGSRFAIREIGMPSGTDDRFLLSNSRLKDILEVTSSVMVFLDVKSSGPRESHDDLVVSPYQVSGDGVWGAAFPSITNTIVDVSGSRADNQFQPAISPVLCLSDGTIAPVIHLFLKTIYTMIQDDENNTIGQPLQLIKLACLPNGIELFVNPGLHFSNRGLLYPGKDERKTPLEKRRARVSLIKLQEIDAWRVVEVDCVSIGL